MGTFTVEFFIDKENNLYVNEIAPRPHNSGHYSIEACDYSQFDTHILAITGQKLPQAIELLKPTVMMNLLGRDLDLLENEFSRHPDWHIHIYGKKERKPDRKMGHMTLLTDDVNQTEQYMLMKFEGETSKCHCYMKVKLKRVFTTNIDGQLRVEYKDEVTAGNGAKKIL